MALTTPLSYNFADKGDSFPIPKGEKTYPPLNFFYKHLHDSIRKELEHLAVLVENLAEDAPLEELQERFKFLGQLNQYHSSVEDEVVYPALDSKVKNVTVAYSVEHQDEEMLFEQLAQLIHTASGQVGLDRTETVRGLICKVEEIHRTLKKHLAKEEEQLLPLLLQHFSFSEQAQLVAQFLYCIPLATVERVLAWLKPTVPKVELEQLLGHMRTVVPDKLLLQLLCDWLKPDSHSTGTDGGPGLTTSQYAQQQQAHVTGQPSAATTGSPSAASTAASRQEVVRTSVGNSADEGREECCGQPEQCKGIKLIKRAPKMATGRESVHTDAAEHQAGKAGHDAGKGSKLDASALQARPPIKEIIHIHRTICAALEDFAREAGLLHQLPGVTPQQLALLVERHRFLRSVCMFHSISEDEIMYPEVRRLAAADPYLACEHVHDAFSACEKEHESEVSALEDLGRLIADVRAFVRRGRKEVDTMLEQLFRTAQQVCSSIAAHMAREEADVFPLLARRLCATQQRIMVWRTLRAMPLRLLERVMPWVTAKLSEEGTQELLTNIRLGAPASDLPLVQLVTRWAVNGRQQAARCRQQQESEDDSTTLAGAAAGLPTSHPSPDSAYHQLPLLAGSSCSLQLQHQDTGHQSPPSPHMSRNASLQHLHQQYLEQQRRQQGLLPLAPQQPSPVPDVHAPLHTGSLQSGMRVSPQQQGLQKKVNAHLGAVAPQQPTLGSRLVAVQPSPTNSQQQLQLPLSAMCPSSVYGQFEEGRSPQEQMAAVLGEELSAGVASKRQKRASDATGGGAHSNSVPVGAGELCSGVSGQQQKQEHSPLFAQQPGVASMGRHSSREVPPLPGRDVAELNGMGPASTRKRGREGEQVCVPPEGLVHTQGEQANGCGIQCVVAQGVDGRTSQQSGDGAVDAAGADVGSQPQQQAAVPSTQEGGQPSATVASGPEGDSSGEQEAKAADMSRASQFNPIDHIFQFHHALRQELKQLESDALGLERHVLSHLRLQEEEQQQIQSQQQQRGQGRQPQGQHLEQQEPRQQQAQQPLQAWSGGQPGQAQQPQQQGQQQQQQQQGQQDVHNMPEGGVPSRSVTPAHGEDSLLTSMGSGMCGYINRLPRRVAAAMQALDGRFQFLWGIYRAHSRSEDEIVFPALESKQALRNVSHAYTLDHQEEEKQFIDLEQIMAALRNAPDLGTARGFALAARRMCAAVRASLETHIRAEEAELWPLFTEHFTTEEQQYLVGVIIGRTGAQVLQALLPWISDSFSLEDKEMLMGSLRQATKNTMFDQWLDAVTTGNAGVAGAAPTGQADNAAGNGGHVLEHPTPRTRHQEDTIDPDLARYLSISPVPGKAEKGRSSSGPSTSGGTIKGRDGPAEVSPVESSNFRPGWEDIFRMNQKQLEAAVMRVSADPNLEPGRKAYLIQNIMVSKYIVAQQRRMQQEQQEEKEEGREGIDASPNDAAAAGVDPVWFQGRAPRRTYHDASQSILGCKHYKRRTQLVAPCCNQVFTCRLCHDEVMPSHRMDRNAVSEMVCMECGTRQPVGSHCVRCATQMARYYCNICHLFDDQEGRDIYHCPFCNVCRRGRGLGIDFFHCMSCNACMSLSLFKVHNCREKAMESNCPVCSEFLFDSADSIKELPCGHFMHTRCFAEYTRYNYTCPICSKSVGDMHVYFQMLDSLLASECLPPEYAGRMQQVLCNDCGKTGFTRFHFAYHSCPHCRSYNTRLL